jgi:hypothetical protein
MGYTRTNFEVGKLYVRKNRPRDAIVILQPAFREGDRTGANPSQGVRRARVLVAVRESLRPLPLFKGGSNAAT